MNAMLSTRTMAHVAVAMWLVAGAGLEAQTVEEARRLLAPSGALRVGVYPGSPTSMVQDPATGERKGLTYDIGMELARRLGVPFEPVFLQRPAEIIDALTSGRADITISNASPARQKIVDFSPTLLDIELGYLVMPGSPVSALANVDHPGVRVGVVEGSTSQATLGRALKQATLVAAPSVIHMIEMLKQRTVDAFATNKGVLYETSDALPGSRVLEGRWGLEHQGLAIPKGRERAMPYLQAFVADLQKTGLLERVAKRAGLRGAVIRD